MNGVNAAGEWVEVRDFQRIIKCEAKASASFEDHISERLEYPGPNEKWASGE